MTKLEQMQHKIKAHLSILDEKITNKQYETYLPHSYLLHRDDLNSLITEVWNEAVEATKIKNKETIEYYQLRARAEAIKECEGCVPLNIPEVEEQLIVGVEKVYEAGEAKGHNSCREQTLAAISKLKT